MPCRNGYRLSYFKGWSKNVYKVLFSILFSKFNRKFSRLSQFYRTLDVSFNSTVQRSTSYLIGLVLGVLLVNLRDVKRDIRIPKGVATIGWLSCVWSLFWCFWHPSSSSNKDFVYEPLDAAVYAAWAPLVWSLAMAWIIFMVFIESGGKELVDKLDCQIFQHFLSPSTKVSCHEY